ncbi:hypothetical protein Tco_1094184 [Tanacetum coccineum]|uniref:Uncharacterized protein n=1 Tax=Tanacetum coccineum TaxID=301880 RepID=A0ABQ5IG24_9ASTR
MQTQEDHSNPIQALSVESLKDNLVVIQNTCSEKEDSNSKTASSKSVKESSLNFETKDVHVIKYKMSKAKERCLAYFRSLHLHLQVLSKEELKGTRIEHRFKRAFISLFGQDADTFTSTMLLNVDQLQKQLDKDEFQEDGSMAAFWVINNQFQKETLLQHMSNVKKSVAERTRHQRQHDRRVKKDRCRRKSGNDTDADDADIRPIYDEEPMAEVQLNVECNIFAIGQQHTEQPEIINEGRVDQSKTIEQTTSLLANNADLKAQIQEKIFAIAALKNDLRKLKGNCIDTKFAKTLVLGKPVLQSLRKQSVIRQPNAFKSERPQMSKQRFASQVDMNNNLSRPVTQHYLPKKKNSFLAKPDHMIASSESRNSSKNMPRFSSNDMVENTGRISNLMVLGGFPTGKLFDSCTSKVDSEPTHSSNVDIPNIHESKQTLDLSAGTSINVQKEQSFDLSAGTSNNVMPDNLRVWLLKKLISQKLVLKWIQN